MFSKITKKLSAGKVQRVCYAIFLLLWVLISSSHFKDYYRVSPIKIKYIWVMVIPAILLIHQIIFNKIYTWALIVLLFAAYTILLVYSGWYDFLWAFDLDNHDGEIFWHRIIGYAIYFILVILLNCLFFMLKPKISANENT
jgi:hypothetical protein